MAPTATRSTVAKLELTSENAATLSLVRNAARPAAELSGSL